MSNKIEEGIIFGIGNPLLDITAHVDHAYIEKYGLKANDAILAAEHHLSIYPDLVANHSVSYIAGGATQNSIRVAQWMLQVPKATTYVGCVGHDTFGHELRRCAEADKVHVEYLVDETISTGKCACLITGTERSLVAHLAAAEKYKLDHLKSEKVWTLVEKARIFYSSGFFLTVSAESALEIGKHAAATNKTLIMNLAAPFICQFFKKQLDMVSPYWDIIFGNETEAACWATANNWETTDIKEIARLTSELPKVNSSRPRIVIFTQGADPVIVYTEGKLVEFPVTRIPKELIVDTNGAGDAFVGGFLSQYAQGASIEQGLKAGQYAAQTVIQHSGCTFPPLPTFS